MPDDNPSPDLLREINERLKYLESVVSEQVSRLYAIEQKLGIAYRPQVPKRTTPQPSRGTEPQGRGGEVPRSQPPAPVEGIQPQSTEAGLPHSPALPLTPPPSEAGRAIPPE